MFKMFRSIRCVYNVRFNNLGKSVDQCRWAGHSKWQNIRHTKEATDQARSKVFNRISRLLAVAIAEGGSPNPELNTKLMQVVEQAKKANMPMSTVQNSIKAATKAKTNEQVIMLKIRGPGRCAFLVDIVSHQPTRAKQSMATILKKHYCKFDDSAVLEFTTKGVLVGKLQGTDSKAFDKAVEDAILSGVEEVKPDENNKVQFECSPERTYKCKKELEDLGYTIESAVVEYMPTSPVELPDADLEVCSQFLKKLEDLPEVVRIIDNIA